MSLPPQIRAAAEAAANKYEQDESLDFYGHVAAQAGGGFRAGVEWYHANLLAQAPEMPKVDRALELQVIDWLQFTDFNEPQDVLGKPEYPRLTLELLYARKELNKQMAAQIAALKAENEQLRSELLKSVESSRKLAEEKEQLLAHGR